MEKDWQPIETAPKDGTKFLAWSRRWNFMEFIGHGVTVAWWFPERQYPTCEMGDQPSHWMPFPAPPSGSVR